MGVRWAAAALVVLGITSMNVRVEAQESLEHKAEMMITTFDKVMKGGKEINVECEYHDAIRYSIDVVLVVAGKSAGQMAEYYRRKAGGDNEDLAKGHADADRASLMTLEQNQEKLCSVGKQLVCESKVCVDCSKAGQVWSDYCDIVVKIYEAIKTGGGGGGGESGGGTGGSGGAAGGWSVRPVNGALVAALLALVLLVATLQA